MTVGRPTQVTTLVLGTLAVLLGAGAATATSLPASGAPSSDQVALPHPVPSGGPGPDTPGTSATISPRSPAPGGTLGFRVSGFPGGETLYVKIDDGKFCAASGVHGACVVHQQRIPASGTVTGSLVLPPDLGAGAHWLRFLASKEIYDDDGSYVGIKGYTLRGRSDFSVAADAAPPAATAAPSAVPSAVPATTSTPAPSASPAAVAQAGATLSLAPGAASATGSPSTAPAPAPSAPAVATAVAPATTAAVPATEPFPIVGVVGLALLGLLALLLVLRSRRARG